MALRPALLSALRALQWPSSSARPGVTAEHYLVLSARRSSADLGTRHPHYALRVACDALLQWYRRRCSDPHYRHSAIAVTKNFHGSAHVDGFDRTVVIEELLAVLFLHAIETGRPTFGVANRFFRGSVGRYENAFVLF